MNQNAQQPAAAPPLSRHRFRVMGCDAELLMRIPEVDAKPLFARAEARLHALSAVMTRFDPTSELEQLNDRGGGVVSRDVRAVLELALEAHSITDGRFDVGVGGDLIAAGYDRTFTSLTPPAQRSPGGNGGSLESAARYAQAIRAATQVKRPPAYRMSSDGNVTIAPGMRIDLGGIAKGWAADQICRGIAGMGHSCLVNLGGDISLFVADGEDPWPIGVQLRDRELSIAVSFGGVATSGQDRRVWQVPDGGGGDGGTAHHVIDPTTRKPSATDVLRITVLDESTTDAEVWATALMLVGCKAARREAQERELTTVIVSVTGEVSFTGSLDGLNATG